jgi:hypothetical protein
MENDVTLETKNDLPATMALTLVLWLCSLVLVGLLVVPLFGWQVGWIVAIGLLVVFVVLCWGVCIYRLVVHEGHGPAK